VKTLVKAGRRRDSAFSRAIAGEIRTLYQPIVSIGDRRTVAFEALSRGPEGTPVEDASELFRRGLEEGKAAELDVLCQTLAIERALRGGLDAPLSLFVNSELSGEHGPYESERVLGAYMAARNRGLPIVFELTERRLLDDPAALMLAVDRARSVGWGVALDDVGADPRALSLLPVIAPDVIKLDLALIREHPDQYVAEVAHAVAAELERKQPASVVAEGVETGEQLERAQALGATHAQGFLFGGPLGLSRGLPAPGTPIGLVDFDEPEGPDATIFDLLSGSIPARIGPESLLTALSAQLEGEAERMGTSAMLIGSFQQHERFAVKAKRYSRLAERLGIVAAIGEGMPTYPASGVRGGGLQPGDGHSEVAGTILLSPHFAAAIAACEVDSEGRGGERRFQIAISHDRWRVARCARMLLSRVEAVSRAA
jgi:EAL domain-containing protein (putative c-di-GMP-specific phosphodiesterase class I)